MLNPRSFSFDKIKQKMTGRRTSEASILEIASTNNRRKSIDISGSNDDRSKSQQQQDPKRRTQSISFMPRSRSLSKSTTNQQQASLHLPHLFKVNTRDLVKQETATIISKKLIHMLQDLGLQNPIPLDTTSNGSPSKNVKIYVANSHDCIFLPPASSTSFTYEDVENGGTIPIILEDEILTMPETNAYAQGSSMSLPEPLEAAADPNHHLHSKMKGFTSPNYLCTKIDSEHPIPHTFAVVVEVLKDATVVKDIKFEFESLTHILWPTDDPYNKFHNKEKFKIGYMDWRTTLADADYYINSSNSNDVKSKNLGPEDLAKRTREYNLINVRDLADGLDKYNKKASASVSSLPSSVDSSSRTPANDTYKAGLYVFLLPILLPEHIPATIVSISGTLNHILSVSVNKMSEKLNRKLKVEASYNLPMVRCPPNLADSIANKPIYVNRVWNDAVHYIITFPRKYVPLGSEHVMNVKLVPLVKDVIIKRIKFNVLERITYVSKNLQKEYDYDSEDPFFLNTHTNKIRERIVSLCELKTKAKQTGNGYSDPYKEEVIKCPDNNLLYSCYEIEDQPGPFRSRKPKDNKENKPMIASPLDINVALPFLTSKSDKQLRTSNIVDDADSNTPTPVRTSTGSVGSVSMAHGQPTSRRASLVSDLFAPLAPVSSPVIGALETNLANHDEVGPHDFVKPKTSNYITDDLSSRHHPPENIQHGYTIVSRALYPDSNFRHIQINHRLQVCFRISKPDPKDDYKMHHYEVVVDTPLVLLSAKCNEGSMQLPEYSELESDIFSSPLSTGPGSVPTPPQTAVSFRIPNYQHNGVKISSWDPELGEHDEHLPSFEEAISVPSSPITRSNSSEGSDEMVSCTKIPSIVISPDEPAPAYEETERIESIDTIVNDDPVDVEPAAGEIGVPVSKIKSSLSSSFATKKGTSADASGVSSACSGSHEGAELASGNSGCSCDSRTGSLSSEEGSIDSGSIASEDSTPLSSFPDSTSLPASKGEENNRDNDDEEEGPQSIESDTTSEDADEITEITPTIRTKNLRVTDEDEEDQAGDEDEIYEQKIPLLNQIAENEVLCCSENDVNDNNNGDDLGPKQAIYHTCIQ
ncbi:ECM21 [[Candida] subhashii]|uniref:ECM21 n=1 Tax=[Candida] subhashii TaxID=561895 RepID=A0A8J5UYJ0_9ASCO|nr:ECM21 [[Candida] subhashii]KAG7663109.1 ECM21 [[Candida] subhashii]